MNIFPDQKTGYDLLHNGAIALSEVEANGLRIDTKYLRKTIVDMDSKIQSLIKDLYQTKLMKKWRKRFGPCTNINSRDQFGKILVEELGVELEETDHGQWKTDVLTVSRLDHPFVKAYLRIGKLQKAVNTYLRGIDSETMNGYLHPGFNLQTVETYRSSSNGPNFQNMPQPSKDFETGSMIRRSFIPRKGRVLLEADYSGVEVCVAACYHKDPAMIKYISDSTKDMHRDMAAQVYGIPIKEVTHELRYFGKNKFIFPQFYGDWYFACAKSLWAAAILDEHKTVKGIPVMRYLKRKGITCLGSLDPRADHPKDTFIGHLKAVEEDFWGRRFQVYGQWKKDWYESYQENGYARTYTGFILKGLMSRNDVINYPVQGSAFHCLLWSLAELVLNELRKAKMKSMIVGQIHDSLMGDVVTDEIEDYKCLLKEVMVDKLIKEFPWIIVPMKVEFDLYPKSWAEKEKE